MATNRRRRVFAALIIVGLMVFGGLSGFLQEPQTPTKPIPAEVQQKAGKQQSAVEALGKIAIKGRAPRTDYSREQFGNGWDTRDSCDLRNLILKRDLNHSQIAEDCKVNSGSLDDPYTGKTIQFTRGQGTSQAVQIDHVVALSDAWQKGAQSLTAKLRLQFANDPLNLLAVDGPINQQKSDGDAATWLPPNKSYRCQYVARQIAVKSKYTLWLTQAEHDAMQRVLGSCPGQVLPVEN